MHSKYNQMFRIATFVFCCIFLSACLCQNVYSVPYTTNSNYESSVYYDRLIDVPLTGDGRVDIVNIALSQYGYSESNNPDNLQGMQHGIYNNTEYGNWYGVQSMWCAMFTSWCAHNAAISQDVIPPHAYTASGLLWFMDRGQSHTRSEVASGKYIPQPGDLIYFHFPHNNSIVNHVGIVIGYFDGYVYTVEGNVNYDPSCADGGQVLMRSRHISDTAIRYFCSPNYSSENAHEVSTFFPSESSQLIDEEITLPPECNDIEYVEITQGNGSEVASEKPQYSFIP